ncbi:hypothetical protein SUGI_0976860 [Cryptomeria japonica]|nr:hypothetical protein SUGI_0976860 [Cryptomeria japonica]
MIEKIGSFVKLDFVAPYSHYTRVCAITDISKLVHHSNLLHFAHGTWAQYLNNEGLPFRCYQCNTVGHKAVDCSKSGSPDTDFIWRNQGKCFATQDFSATTPSVEALTVASPTMAQTSSST